MERIGFIGTGLLGGPMAARLAACGRRVVAWNRTPSKAAPLRSLGVDVVEAPKEVFEAAGVVLLMLADALAIEDVLVHRVGIGRLAGRTVVQMGTIGPGESVAFRERFAAARVRYLEAPVMGTIPHAETGSLIVMVGCEKGELEPVRPILEAFGPVNWVGPVGTASTLKLALNHLIAAHATAFAASLAVVHRAGLDVDLFMNILRQTNLHAPLFDKKLPLMRARRYDAPHFPTKHLLKDARLFLEAAGKAGISTPAMGGIVTMLTQAVESGLGDCDYAALYEVVDRLKTS